MDWLPDAFSKLWHLFLSPQVFAPIVSAAITAFALLLQNQLLAKREREREMERNKHEVAMATITEESNRRRYAVENRDKYDIEQYLKLESTCQKILGLVQERDEQVKLRSADVAASRPLTEDSVMPVIRSNTSARVLIAQLHLINVHLAEEAKKIFSTQQEAVGALINDGNSKDKRIKQCRELRERYEELAEEFAVHTRSSLADMHPHGPKFEPHKQAAGKVAKV